MASNESFILTAAAVTASATMAALTLVQTDAVSRYLLDPKRLQLKRAKEHSYKWQTALEKACLQQNYFLAGGMERFNNDPDCVGKQTDFIKGAEELEALANRIVKDKSAFFRVLRVDTDPHDPLKGYYVFLSEEDAARNNPAGDPSIDTIPPSRLIQVPLASFCKLLRQAFDDQITTTTMCFVADSSSGAATKLIENIVSESKSGVAISSEPLWMTCIAALTDQNEIPDDVVDDAIYALCRCESWRLRDMARDSKTVMFTLPGQASTPILLPLVQRIFPEERHVFSYDGCSASVQRGIQEQADYARNAPSTTLTDSASISHNPIRHTTPLVRRHITRSIRGLTPSLGKLPNYQAQIVETWMTSVDMFFQLKTEDASNGYLPYVFKYALLTDSNLSFETEKGDAYWSVASLLQFITGCRSRPLPVGVLDAAIEWLKEFNSVNSSASKSAFSEIESKNIENCVFQHKYILIGNKTLQDTVLPKQHWTLKQASRKGGCACCAPEEEEEEQQEAGEITGASVPGAFATALNNTPSKSSSDRSKYVDGKMGFAFDPTKFS